MKKIFLLAMMVFALNSVDAQLLKYGLRVGGGTTSIDATPQDIFSPSDSLLMTLGSSHFGFHVGGFARVTVKNLFFQPEVLFNTRGHDYTVYDTDGNIQEVLEDRFSTLDIPLIIGYKFSSLRFQAGPVGSMTLTNANDLVDYFQEQEDLVSTLQGFNWGWQVGLGLDISKFMIDIKYEGNFQPVGNGITIDGNTYDFDGRANRFIVTFGYSF
ncbi:MAG: porin family protein [Saprospiraceae bacterium]